MAFREKAIKAKKISLFWLEHLKNWPKMKNSDIFAICRSRRFQRYPYCMGRLKNIESKKWDFRPKKAKKGQNDPVQFLSYPYNMGIVGIVSTCRLHKYPNFFIFGQFFKCSSKKRLIVLAFVAFSRKAIPWRFYEDLF